MRTTSNALGLILLAFAWARVSLAAGVVPWEDRIAGTMTASFMQAAHWEGFKLHDGIDVRRSDGPVALTPIVAGSLVECNDTDPDRNRRYLVISVDNGYLVYVHVDQYSVQTSILQDFGCDCASLPSGGVLVSAEDEIATGWGDGLNVHFGFVQDPNGRRWESLFNEYTELRLSFAGAGDNDPPYVFDHYNCPPDGISVGQPWTVFARIEDEPGTADPFSSDIVLPPIIKLVDISEGGGYQFLHVMNFDDYELDTVTTDFDDFYTCFGADCYLRIPFEIPGPANELHYFKVSMTDFSWNEQPQIICDPYTEITRSISNLTAIAEAGQIRVSWSAVDFDPGVQMLVWRSDDFGVTYNHLVDVIGFDGNGDYETIDVEVEQLGYCYMIQDTEGGEGVPGPDPWWGPARNADHPTDVPNPAAPVGAPEIVVSTISSDEVSFEVLEGVPRTSVMHMDGTIDDTFDDCGPVLTEVGLSPGETHSFRFRPANAGGYNTYTDWLEMRAIDPPDAVSAFGVSNAIEVWWDPVPGADTYMVEYQLSGTAEWEEEECASPGCLLTDLVEESTYYVGVRSVDEFGNTTRRSQLVEAETGDGTVAVDPPRDDDMEYWISVPNPIVESSNVRFGVAGAGVVSVTIVDAVGRVVDELVNAEMLPGAHEVEWNLEGYGGFRVSNGIYFVVVRHGTGQSVRKVLVMR
jgi:hypothetical protein